LNLFYCPDSTPGQGGTLVSTPSDIVDSSYKLISFEPGAAPEWERFRELFVDQAVLALRVFPTDPAVSVMTLAEYAQSQMRHDLQDEGYSETPGSRSVEVVGDVATVRQEFTLNYAGKAPVAARDIFSMARTPDGWKIVSIVSDVVDE
jgi:putative lumazine-binding protein